MRRDGHAGRGKGTQLVFQNEYDLQNMTELILSPVMALQREPFTVKCQGVERSADFSFAGGRLILELKMSRNRSALDSALQDAKGELGCYLDHPGVELALAVIEVTASANADKNAIESWIEFRGDRRAIMRVVDLPEDVLTAR
jgi:hypothetical protein